MTELEERERRLRRNIAIHRWGQRLPAVLLVVGLVSFAVAWDLTVLDLVLRVAR